MNLVEWMDENSVEYVLEGDKHCRPGWLQMRCPYCSDGRTGSFHLGHNLTDGRTNCYRCGGHHILGVLSRLSGVSFQRLKESFDDIDATSNLRIERRTGRLTIPRGVGPLLSCHKDYLRGRRLDPKQVAELWGVGGIGLEKHFKWRLFIPIHKDGETVSWTTRSIGERSRYMAAKPEEESYNHRRLLYGEEYCNQTIIIHEGPIDVWTTGPGATCTFGTAFNRAQVLRMARYRKRIVCFDNQPSAQQQAEKLCSLLEPFPGETLNVLLDAKDSNEATEKERRALRKLLK